MNDSNPHEADVTVCIPAWQAEAFIARTLRCAREQTYPRLRILVSVDQGDDATAAICREHAAEDARIEVIEQPGRLGWSENANALLARVDTEFFFLYFHDDIIEPRYVEKLRAALLADPDAMSAHSDLERFGVTQGVDPGRRYDGDACRRLLTLLVAPVKGAILRSLVRREVLARGLHFPQIGEAGFWRCFPFSLTLVASGPAVHVPEVLYRRWHRAGGVTASWSVATDAPLVEGMAASARLCRAIVEEAAGDPAQLRVLRHALCLSKLLWTRREELRLGAQAPLDSARIHADFAHDRSAPAACAALPEEERAWLAGADAELQALEARFPGVVAA